ncbi:hypothetical protein C8R44DRAFT_745949 [Mycena epipterygia]|nr:hypothetical protein C8R44DRAFT_745949 [Mycena epipterygia]
MIRRITESRPPVRAHGVKMAKVPAPQKSPVHGGQSLRVTRLRAFWDPGEAKNRADVAVMREAKPREAAVQASGVPKVGQLGRGPDFRSNESHVARFRKLDMVVEGGEPAAIGLQNETRIGLKDENGHRQEPTSHLAQELVDHIISFLHDSPTDWPACALVSHSCIRFVSAHSANERRWARFQETTHTSLHLIQHIWDRCSPSLKHLELSYYPYSFGMFSPPQHSSLPIQLESLALRNTSVRQWLTHPHCPLDFSGLIALSIQQDTELLGSQTFALARQTVQTLDLMPEPYPEARVYWTLDGYCPEKFDSLLSGLPISPTTVSSLRWILSYICRSYPKTSTLTIKLEEFESVLLVDGSNKIYTHRENGTGFVVVTIRVAHANKQARDGRDSPKYTRPSRAVGDSLLNSSIPGSTSQPGSISVRERINTHRVIL